MMPSLSRLVENVGALVGATVVLLFGLYQGTSLQTVTLDFLRVTVRIVVLEAFTGVAGFTLIFLATGVLLVREVWTARDDEACTTSGPALNAIVPVYRDHTALDVSVESLVESAYEDLTVTVVVEPNDDPTVQRARTLAERYDPVEVLVNGRPGSKAGAINYAVAESDADYFAVFDADEWVAPEFLPRAVGELQGDADVFQGRRVPRPTGAVETLAYCERVLFHAGYMIVERLGFNNCRSSSTAFTREAFERVGGYDDVLTEDLAFAHEAYREGLSVTHVRQWTNTMEAPHTVRDLWGQRKRWRLGQIEVLHHTLVDAISGRMGRRGLLSIGRLGSSLLGSLGILALAGKVLLLVLLSVEAAFAVTLLCLLAVIGAVAARDALDQRIDGLHWSVVFVFLVYPAFGVLTLKALFEYCLSWSGEWYRVAKTGA